MKITLPCDKYVDRKRERGKKRGAEIEKEKSRARERESEIVRQIDRQTGKK